MSVQNKSPYVEAYLSELVKVGKKHGFCLSHEDAYGGFEVRIRELKCPRDFDKWLMRASYDENPWGRNS